MKQKTYQKSVFLIGYHFDGRYVIDSNRYGKGDLDYLFYLDSIDHFDEAVDLMKFGLIDF
jgi:hypothetical protein